MTDLTALTTPFGLLDRETQEALKAHDGPWENYSDGAQWQTCFNPKWYDRTVYRAKPAPPKLCERWATNQILHETREKAESFRAELIAVNPGLEFPPIRRFVEMPE